MITCKSGAPVIGLHSFSLWPTAVHFCRVEEPLAQCHTTWLRIL